MFRSIQSLAVIVMFFAFSSCESMKESTKQHSPEAVAEHKGQNFAVAVNYCRPYKKGRVIFGSDEEDALVPYGEKWRTGANEATEITFTDPVMFGGKKLEAGTYSLYTIPGPEQWTLAINNNTGYWGRSLFGDTFDEEEDVLRVDVPARTREEEIEQFTIAFEQNGSIVDMNLMWDNTIVTVPIRKL